MRRVVITGMGIISSIGNSTQEVTASLREAKSGIVAADKYKELGFRCQVHGQPHYDLDTIDRRVRRFMADGAAWNYVAMQQAIVDGGVSSLVGQGYHRWHQRPPSPFGHFPNKLGKTGLSALLEE